MPDPYTAQTNGSNATNSSSAGGSTLSQYGYKVPTSSVAMQGGNAPGGVTPQNQQPADAVGGFQTQGYQYGMPSAGGIQMGAMGPNGQPLGYIDPSQAAVHSVDSSNPYYQKASDAYYQQATSRLDPQWQQQQSDLESKLENMGLSRGSEAWTREMSNMTQGRNDAYNQAQLQSILTGGQEASRMQGMDINAGNFANQAQQQDYENRLKSQQGAIDLGNFANNAQAQQFGQNKSAAELNNAALTAQQQSAQGWGSLRNQLEVANKGLQASQAGASSAANAAAMNAASNERIAQMNASLQARQIGNQERQQDFNMAWDAQMNPYRLQDAAMSGQGPTYDNNFGNYGQNAPNMPAVDSSRYIGGSNQAIQQGNQAMGSMGGNLINQFGNWMGMGG